MNPTPRAPADSVIENIQFNCDVSDARYAREATMCVYLLRMREFYRWRHDIALGVRLSLDDVGDWLSGVEEYWDTVEEEPLRNITIGSSEFDPFDCDAINAAFDRESLSWTYSAGVGRRGKPHFFLAQTLHVESQDELTLTICGRELARDLVAQPAMSRDRSVWVRQDSVRRYLWELYEDWSFRRNDGPMARLAARFGFAANDDLEEALNRAATSVQSVLVAHELGEVEAEAVLPAGWHDMFLKSRGTTDEIYARAVRDSLADTLGTWPAILAANDHALLDFWLAGIDGARKQVIESSPAGAVLKLEDDGERMQLLGSCLSDCANWWTEIATQMVSQQRGHGDASDFAALAINT